MRMCMCVCMLRLTHYIVATIAAESPARIIAAVLYPHYTTSQHTTHNNQTQTRQCTALTATPNARVRLTCD